MSGVTGVTETCRTALAGAITTAGIACRSYDAWDIGSGLIATLGAASWQLDQDYDQSYGIKSIVFPVLVYQLVDGNAEKSLEYMDANLEVVVNAIGQNRTLGGSVADSTVDGNADLEFFRESGGATYAVLTVPVRVFPFPNRGA